MNCFYFLEKVKKEQNVGKFTADDLLTKVRFYHRFKDLVQSLNILHVTFNYCLKAEELMDTFQFELAKSFCDRAIEQEPTHLKALETCGIIAIELGDLDRAKQV